MRNVWLTLAICGLQGIAAEKSRDWKTGQVVESDDATASLHTVASTDRSYLVRGTAGNSDQALAVGASVRFAVEGKTMFVSLEGKEYRLYVLGERLAGAQDPGTKTAGVAAPKSPPPVVAPPITQPAKPAAQAGESLDNDAVVKMVVAGLKDDTIIRVIETRPGKYLLSRDATLGLKAAGVSPNVIAAMSAKMTGKH